MTQPTEIWSSQLRIAAGRAVEEAPQVGFAEKRDQLGRLVRLSILAEPAADGAEAFVDQFVRRLGELFDPAARSLTGAVNLALETTHEELRAWNRQHLPDEHAMYGVAMLIQRTGQPAVLGQAGPSVALLAGDAGAAGLRSTAFYARRPRQEDPVAAAVGGSDPITVEFVSAPEAADGWALLLTSNAAPLLDAERRVALSRLAVDQTLRQLYPAMLNLRDAAGLVVSLGDAAPPPDNAADHPQSDGRDRHPPLDERSESEEPAVDSGPPDRDQYELDPGASPAPAGADPAEPAAIEAPDRPRAAQWEVTFDPPALTGSTVSAELAEWEVAGWPVNPFAATAVVPLQTLSPPLASSASSGLSAPPLGKPIMELGRAIPSLLEQRREPAVEPPQIRTRDPRARAASARRAGLVLLAMLAVLAGVAAVLLGPALLQSDEDQFRASVERARNGLAASQLTPTTEAARLVLQDALLDVQSALELNPLAAEALQLREELEAVLAELNLVQSPGDLTTLADLSRFGPAIALGSVRFGGGRAFVLDDAGGRVFSIGLDGAVAVIFLEGELLGLGGQLRAGKPISLAWQPAQSGPSAPAAPAANGAAQSAAGSAAEEALWILDSHARLYRWTPSGVLLVPIPDQVRLGSVDAVAATAGSVYLLDQAGGAVWRLAVERSQLSEPVRAVGRTDLLNASELVAAINASGEVEFLVASSDGRLRRFSGADELPLALDLERNLLNPASLSLGAQSGLVYAVDRGAGRIIAVGPDGGVVSQIRAAELAELRGAWINEASGQIIYALPASILVGRLPGGQE